MTRLQTFALGVLLIAATAATSLAAIGPSGYWAYPSTTPNTDVICTTCPCKSPSNCSNAKLTPGYPATLGKYVGRFVDSQNTEDYQSMFRTARAKYAYPSDRNGRIYMVVGSAVFAYNADTFFTRAGSRETLIPASVWGTHPTGGITITYDTYLNPDNVFYAESKASGWDVSSGADGQERLGWIDFDDRGYVYPAYSYYGWGILKDDLSSGAAAAQLSSVFQYATKMQIGDDVSLPLMTAVLRSAVNPSTYYLLVSDTSAITNVFDVTNTTVPVRYASIKKPIIHFAKTTDLTRMGVITVDGKLEIYSSDTFVVSGRPLYAEAAPAGSLFEGIGSDGTNFYVAIDTPNGLTIRSYAPDANGYHKVAELATNRSTPTTSLRYNDGYITHVGYWNGGPEMRLFKANVSSINEVDTHIAADPTGQSTYFQNYYVRTSLPGYTAAGKWGQFFDSSVMTRNGHTYLLVTAYGLGDVYELNSSDTIAVRNSGSVGTPNSFHTGGGTGPFYGDPIAFSATTSSGSAATVNYDFGNPEAAAGGDPNTDTKQTGQQTTHRYSGITSLASLPITRTVKAVSAADANVNGATTVTLAAPSLSAAIQGYKALPLQANSTLTTPIVVGDHFIDTSDGSVESHFTTWTIGGTPTPAKPNEPVGVGACSASQTLTVAAHYGPYSGTSPNLTSASDLPISVAGIKYSVGAFAASADVVPSGGNVVFRSSSRFTSDPAYASALAGLQYKWELVDANGTAQTSPAPVTGTGTSIPDFPVSKSIFGQTRGLRAHLVITSPTALPGNCATTSEFFTLPLNGPEPKINGGCTNGAPPCNFTVASLNAAIDPVSDGWTYAWAIDGSTVAGAAAQSFSPTFSSPGAHTISVSVTNAVGNASAQTSVTINKTSSCQTIVPGVTFFIYYSGASSHCFPANGPCGTGETVSFAANVTLGYNLSCSTHTYSWDFGDGTPALSGQNVTHTFSSAKTYNVTLTVTNDAGAVPTSLPVDVSSTITTPPPSNPPPSNPPSNPPPSNPPPNNPPPVTPGGCNPLDFSSFYVSYVNAAQTCSIYTTNACNRNESISFDATPSFYNVGCGAHSYNWNFGDNSTGSGKSPTHAYTANGTYTVSVQVTNPKGSSTYTAQITIGQGTTPPPTQNPPPPTPGGSCGTITSGQSVWVSYQGATSNCSAGGLVGCDSGETLNFTVSTLTYDFSCGNHTFSWDFKDGSDPQTGRSVSHVFNGPGTYNVTCNITVNGNTTPVTQAVIVSSGPGNPVGDPNAPFDFDFRIDPIQVNGTLIPHNYLFTAFPTGTATASSYHWDFGDGETGNGSILAHTYKDGADHTITLTVPGVAGFVTHTLSPPKRRASGH